MTVFFTPHHDDETLFGAFTLIRERPMVIVCYPSEGDYGPTQARLGETRAAVAELGAGPVEQWHGGALEPQMRALLARVTPTRAWAPHYSASHQEHRLVNIAARTVFGDAIVREYHTYDEHGKVRAGERVTFQPAWIGRKLRALAAYQTQWSHPRAHRFFTDDLHEYAEGA